MTDDQPALPGLRPLGDLIPKLKKPSRIKNRLIEASTAIAADDPDEIYFQHTVFCQTAMPYRDPGADKREWERTQGKASLLIEAGRARHPETGEWLRLGLPFGPKPRLILAYLNTAALRTGCAEIEVEDSLTAFVGRLRLDPNGHTIRTVKDQLARLSASTVRLGIMAENHSINVNATIVSAFDLWLAKDDRQRVLWPSTVRLSLDYFTSLQKHAVPLDERALRALSHSAMGLDIYSWLAQRLHRIDPRKPQFIPWSALKEQFGWHYSAMFKFKQVFRHTLTQVLMEYRAARIELDGRGMTMRNSPPPVKGRIAVVRSLPAARSQD
jgi:Plasmid encoded RepA protein